MVRAKAPRRWIFILSAKFLGSILMSVFGKIMSAIFGAKADATTSGATPTAGGSAPSSPAPSGGSASAPTSAPAAKPGSVDVAPILDKAVAAQKEKLEWRTSIVDLMKALDIDSSLASRKELAKELHYSGDTNDSATMNVWLHKQVMTKLAENGGKLPADMKV
jgi:zona occludens toxin (predicted ATPase)